MRGWRYIATRLNGDGTETFLDWAVPVTAPKLTDDLSGPGGFKAAISAAAALAVTPDGDPVFKPWSTAIYAEKDGVIRGGGILTDNPENGPSVELDCVGFTGYLAGQPYGGDISVVDVDPLDMARLIWAYKQEQPDGNLGLELDPTTSPVRIGAPETTSEFATSEGETVSITYGPYKLSWWTDHDLGKAFEDLATETPFDYRVVHEWDGDRIRHRLILGYPTIGARREDLRFMVGENIFVMPAIQRSGDTYASEVVVLGAGEGRKMVRNRAVRPAGGRLHRAVVVQDKSLRSHGAALTAAERELQWRAGEDDITEITVVDHSHARLGSFHVGDQILVQSPPGRGRRLNLWVRIMSLQWDLEKDQAALTVERVEKTEK